MSDSIADTDDQYYFFAYELVHSVYQYIEVDTPFPHLRATPSTPRIFNDDHYTRLKGFLNVLVLPLMVSQALTKVGGKDINITEDSYKSAVRVAVNMYKEKDFSVDQFFIMCTSIAIWAFLARNRGLPDAAKEAIEIIKDLTTQVLRNGSFENASW